MQRLLDNGFTVSVQQEKIYPVGTYRLSVWKELVPPPRNSTKKRKWISLVLTELLNYNGTLERIADELGLK